MKEVSGQISMLGNSRVSRDMSTYSLIKIGGLVIEQLQCPDAMDNFLHVAFDEKKNCTLYIQGRRLVGIKLSGEDFYCYKMSPVIPLALIALGCFFLSLFWLIAPLFLSAGLFWIGIKELKNSLAGKKLKAQGAIPLSVTSRTA